MWLQKTISLAKSRWLLVKLALLMGISVLLISCESVGYYSQAVRGQAEIILGRESIQRLLHSNDDIPADLSKKLRLILALREFAETELQLPVGENYSTYVDLEREYVVWNVFAAPEFSTTPLNWCFPIAGCVSYRGYFSEHGASNYAKELAQQGYDVYTGGVDAYSTLGWFDDSLLSTVIDRADHQLAALVFHELAHQVVYLPGDTTFNESFATAVEQEGLRRWLAARGTPELLDLALRQQHRQQGFVDLVSEYQEQFATLYQSDLDSDAMGLAKVALQQQLRQAYQSLKIKWGGYRGYDGWFSRSLNNAQLSTVASYNDLVPQFRQLLSSHENDLSSFYGAVIELSEMSDEARAQRLGQFD